MKTLLLTSIFSLFIVLSIIMQAHTTLKKNSIPQPIIEMIDTLTEESGTVKMIFDEEKGQVYWLSFVGNLHTVTKDGNDYQHINAGQTFWRDITFIEDFCLNASKDSLYFTDLMDLQSGHSAIKITDINGTGVKVVATLDNEIPYHISFSPEQHMLFYLSKVQKKGIDLYQLRFLNLKEGQKGTLYSSRLRINELKFDKEKKAINILNQKNEQFAFSVDLQNIQGIAEAFKPE